MAGHNKWTQIKRQKAVVDAAKGRAFSLLAKEITLQAKRSGGDRTKPDLRAVLEKARKANLPNDNIARALARATGLSANNYEEIMYEAYLGEVALIIIGLTGNVARSTQELRHLLIEHGANLAARGAAEWAFEKQAGAWRAKNFLKIPDEAAKKNLENLIIKLRERDDVTAVHTNAESVE